MLSEDEQRILQDIERNFYENDPKFAQVVGTSGLYRHASRNCKLSGLGFFLSLGLLLGSFFESPLLGLVGFVAMLACAAVFIQNFKRIGVTGLKDVAESDRVRHASDGLHEFRERWNNKFHRP